MFQARQLIAATTAWFCVVGTSGQTTTNQFRNFETAPIHPVDISPDGKRLAVCNLPDNRVEIFDLEQAPPVHLGSVFVGIDPVTARFRSANELWVVNHISDSINIVDVGALRVAKLIEVPDGPCDVVFAGEPVKAFISCAPVNLVVVLNAATLEKLKEVEIDGERPKSLAVSKDGSKVYAAIFESGNKTTILAPRFTDLGHLTPAGPLDFPDGPYGGVNPPPNLETNFFPEINPKIPASNAPPRVSLIVKKMPGGRWMDDNGGDWTEFVSGEKAAFTGRVPGWDLPDHDVAVIDSESQEVSYISGLMNIGMSLAVNPVSGVVAMVGTDALNHIRFEPVLQSSFIRVQVALIDVTSGEGTRIADINHHLDYKLKELEENERKKTLSDPRGIVWSEDGTRMFVTGMGTDNLVALDADGKRVGNAVALGAGASGLALDGVGKRLFVLNRFEGSVSVLDSETLEVKETLTLHDPTPVRLKLGRTHFYNTHKTSGLGLVACASCHLDGRFDRLAWDLGAPGGEMKFLTNYNFANDPPVRTNHFHPMKGPMTTQTLQDIIGHEPLHWRGDKDGLEEFNATFVDLQGREEMISDAEMQEFEDFLASMHFPPNRFRNFDNSLPVRVSMKGHKALGRGARAKGEQLPEGDARAGFTFFRGGDLGGCAVCHTLPTGHGTDKQFLGGAWRPITVGKNGENHSAVNAVPRSGELPFKIPHLRNLHEKVGFDASSASGTSGFGFTHDGRVDTLTRFIQDGFGLADDQDTANLAAFMLAFSGSDMAGNLPDVSNPPGRASKDAPAATGKQLLLAGSSARFDEFIRRATVSTGRVELVVKIAANAEMRGFWFVKSNGTFQTDRLEQKMSKAELLGLVSSSNPGLALIVPEGTGMRLGIDRDSDGALDGDEIDAGTNPAAREELAGAPGAIRITNARQAGGRFELEWMAAAGQQFRVEERSDPGRGEWREVEEEVKTEAGVYRWSVGIEEAGAKFYRVQLLR